VWVCCSGPTPQPQACVSFHTRLGLWVSCDPLIRCIAPCYSTAGHALYVCRAVSEFRQDCLVDWCQQGCCKDCGMGTLRGLMCFCCSNTLCVAHRCEMATGSWSHMASLFLTGTTVFDVAICLSSATAGCLRCMHVNLNIEWSGSSLCCAPSPHPQLRGCVVV
jgi:hypothetical protein